MSVLGTKLHLPSPRRRLVSRPRITDQLLAAGKTTLLAQRLARF